LQAYFVGWRRGRVRASVITTGIAGGTSAVQAVELAKKQAARIRR
jgi:hypothetical protein